MAQSIRSFIAVEISRAVREKAVQLISRLDGGPAKVKWVEAANLHITLHFLGEVEMRHTPDICRAVSRAIQGQEAFEVRASGAGAFPDTRRPRTVWLGISEGSDAMVAMHGAIGQELEDLGYRTERRRFRPHITLGRVRGAMGARELAEAIEGQQDFDGGRMQVQAATVFSSELIAQGPRYTVLGRCRLEGSSD